MNTKTLSAKQTLEIIEKFYQECLHFWRNQEKTTQRKMALQDVSGLETNPYSPDGEQLRIWTRDEWVAGKERA